MYIVVLSPELFGKLLLAGIIICLGAFLLWALGKLLSYLMNKWGM